MLFPAEQSFRMLSAKSLAIKAPSGDLESSHVLISYLARENDMQFNSEGEDMANNDSNNYEKLIREIAQMLPEGIVPDSYIEYLILENEDIADTKDELLGNVKMQLSEETGVDIPMTRKEAEEYLYDSLTDEQWETLSHNSMISSRQVKVFEDYDDKTVLEIIKEMPLIPASKVFSSIIANYLSAHGQEITPEREMDIMEDMIHMLGSSFSEVFLDDDDDDDELELEFEDGFEIDGDWDEDDEDGLIPGTDPEDSENPPARKMRRSRITRFPGRK